MKRESAMACSRKSAKSRFMHQPIESIFTSCKLDITTSSSTSWTAKSVSTAGSRTAMTTIAVGKFRKRTRQTTRIVEATARLLPKDPPRSPCHYIMVEADIHLRPLHKYILDIHKVFEPLACCLKGI